MDAGDVTEERAGSRNGIQVIARAAAVLRSLKDAPGGLSLGQIAERVSLPRSTVQRIVQALQGERLVISAGSMGGVRLGPEVHALADAAQFSVVDRCRPYMQAVAAETGETVDLSVLRGGRMIFLDQIPGTHRLRAVSSVGEVFPLTVTANGRACLSLMAEVDAKRLAEEEWSRLNIAEDWPSFARMLNAVRASGLAEDCDSHTDGISALGFAFPDHAGDLHSISVPIPSSRFVGKRRLVEAVLQRARAELYHLYGE